LDLRALIARQKPAKPLYKALQGDFLQTVISFDNTTSERRTIIDLETEDRVGLLYVVSKTFLEMGLDLALAKIVTEKGAAIDSFYVRYVDGGKITDPAQQAEIQARLLQAIGSLS
jgi:[protein-PII] uridylyltransferase